MTERQERAGADPEKRHEAENLARAAVEELERGNKEEGKFLAQEARELDPKAAEPVLKGKEQKTDGRSKSASRATSAKSEDAGRHRKSGGAAAARLHGRASKPSEKRETHEQRGGSAKRTVDHAEIRAWIEERGGRPSVVKRSHDTEEGGGILRIDFEKPEMSLEEVPWDEFFETFEDRQLAFLHQDRTADGQLSRFFKFVRRDAEENGETADEGH